MPTYRDLVTRLRFAYGPRDRRLLARYERQTDGLRRRTRGLAAANNTLAASNARVGASFAGVGKSFAGLGVAFGVALTGKGISDAGDALDTLENRIRSIEGSDAPIRAIRRELTALSVTNFAKLEDTAQIFQRFRLGTQDLGRSRDEIIEFTDLVQKAAIVSGSSPTETNNALIQFAQGIASNRFSGEEFRSVSEQIPTLIRTLKRQLGVTTGELRELAFAGDLTADVIFDAFSADAENILADFQNLRLTRPLGISQLQTGFTTFFGAFAQGSEFNEAIAQFSGSLGTFFVKNEKLARRWGAATVGALTLVGDAFGAVFGGVGVGSAVSGVFADIRVGLDQAQRFLNIYQALRDRGQSRGDAFSTATQTLFGADAAERMQKVLAVLKPIGQAIGAIFATRAVALFLRVVTNLFKRFGPFGAAVTVISAAFALWNKENSNLRKLWMQIVELWEGPLGDAIRSIAAVIGVVLVGAFKLAVNIVDGLLGSIVAVIEGIKELFGFIKAISDGGDVGFTGIDPDLVPDARSFPQNNDFLSPNFGISNGALVAANAQNAAGATNTTTSTKTEIAITAPITVTGGDPMEVKRVIEEVSARGLAAAASGAQ